MILLFFARYPNLCLNRALVWLSWMYKYTATSDQSWDVTPMPHVETVTITTRSEPLQQTLWRVRRWHVARLSFGPIPMNPYFPMIFPQDLLNVFIVKLVLILNDDEIFATGRSAINNQLNHAKDNCIYCWLIKSFSVWMSVQLQI